MLLADRTLAATGNAINSTLDLKLQQTLERQLQNYIARERRVGIVNASAMLLDTRDMGVRAVVGSANFFDEAIDGQVNGTLARRSPGSTLKPFIYGLALDQGLLHPMTMLKDAPTAFGPFTPENFDGRFAGPITAREALIKSRNVPAVAVSARLAQPTLYQFLKSAAADADARELHWFANEAYLGAAKPGVSMGWQPSPGAYILRVVDDHGRSGVRDVRVELVQ